MTRPNSGTRGHIDDQQAAWELHVELATRISVVPLPQDQGLLSEALGSLDALMTRTREILREHGPHDAAGGDACAFQRSAWIVTEDVIGPYLARWKPRLAGALTDESLGAGPVDRERAWPDGVVLRSDLEQIRQRLTTAATDLAELADAQSLIIDQEGLR